MEKGSEMLVIHNPGGGFRRFVTEGSTLRGLDGAEPLVLNADHLHGASEFSVAGDRHRLPNDPDPRL